MTARDIFTFALRMVGAYAVALTVSRSVASIPFLTTPWLPGSDPDPATARISMVLGLVIPLAMRLLGGLAVCCFARTISAWFYDRRDQAVMVATDQRGLHRTGLRLLAIYFAIGLWEGPSFAFGPGLAALLLFGASFCLPGSAREPSADQGGEE